MRPLCLATTTTAPTTVSGDSSRFACRLLVSAFFQSAASHRSRHRTDEIPSIPRLNIGLLFFSQVVAQRLLFAWAVLRSRPKLRCSSEQRWQCLLLILRYLRYLRLQLGTKSSIAIINSLANRAEELILRFGPRRRAVEATDNLVREQHALRNWYSPKKPRQEPWG